MKKLLQKIEIPTFLRDIRLVIATTMIFALCIIGALIGLALNLFFGMIIFIIFLLLVVSFIYGTMILSENTTNFVSNLSYRIKRGEQEALIKMPIGILLYDEKKQIQWVNPYLQLYFGNKEVIGKKISAVDYDLSTLVEKSLDSQTIENQVVTWGKRQFEMSIQDDLGVLYLLDVTRYAAIEQRYLSEKMTVGQLFLDNYDELSQSMDDQTISSLNNYITHTLTSWASQYEMYLKRVDDDHFLILAHFDKLNDAERDRFMVLDKIREETSKQNYPITLSIGFAYGVDDLNELATLAQRNLDLALGRGGDQVVIKNQTDSARFYGGKSNPMEKRTRVRARMVSQALRDTIKDRDEIFVMGHRHPDMDAIGAALGISRIAKMNNKKAYVVLDNTKLNYDVKRLYDLFLDKEENAERFVTPQQALSMADEKSLLVMVDHSKPSMSESQELYQKLENSTVVIDHHRRGEEFPENPMLVYIEPYASSTCELVTEMLEYQPKKADNITKIEASAMLAGIIVDTKSFSLRTGTRTFDAASYLRSVGADNKLIQDLLKEDLNQFINRNHLISTIEIIKPGMALLKGEDDQIYDPIVAAQAVDMSLSLDNIEAAFIITRRDKNTIGISARSVGKVNVQVIMEKLGGGGHLSNAATQLKDETIDVSSEQLIKAIDSYQAEEEPEEQE